MKGKVASTKSATKAYVLFCLSLSADVSPALQLRSWFEFKATYA